MMRLVGAICPHCKQSMTGSYVGTKGCYRCPPAPHIEVMSASSAQYKAHMERLEQLRDAAVAKWRRDHYGRIRP